MHALQRGVEGPASRPAVCIGDATGTPGSPRLVRIPGRHHVRNPLSPPEAQMHGSPARDGARHPELRLALLLGAAALLADWASKSWALAAVASHPIDVGSRVLLGVVRNDALAFSSMGGMPVESVLALRITCVVVLLVLATRYALESRRLACAFALLIAGGIGNVADLFLRGGAVVDFIGVGPFPVGGGAEAALVFNLADVWIKAGVVLAFPLIRRAAQRAQRASLELERRILPAR